ncbi:MAG: polysaccharide deacetylase family protein [Mariniphaga sp.]|nr:polysaccharide deacetylase family protein [Mariniphaga sp.]
MILIYTDELNPRIEYISRLIFTTILQNEVSFTVKSSEFLKSELPKLNYSYEKFGNEFYIKPHRFLHCKALIQPNIQPVWYKGEKYFFESSKDSDLPFDPLAASFYLVTRYEEYLEFEKGKYSRFQAKESILEKYGLLKKPVVNIWARLLREKLKERFPEIQFPEPKFHFLPTIDVDNAWAFSNKGFWRTLGAFVRSAVKGNFSEVNHRLKVWKGSEKDPYDTFQYLDEVFKGNEDKVLFFFLLGDYKRYDKNNSWRNKHFQKLIRETAGKYTVGIHPSYSSSKKKGKKKLISELDRLKKITGSEVKKSRQHFLRLRFPRTYRRLINTGILEDYTMGYASQTGFRAGICTPYFFYDLKKEEVTSLNIIPFQIMDVTLRHYLNLKPEEAIAEIEALMQEVKKVGGTFSAIWHNETVNDEGVWKGYREVFEKMNKLGFELSDA